VIGHFQRHYLVIVADRVGLSASAFWAKVGFSAESIDCCVWCR
jgi:hypothetical protein